MRWTVNNIRPERERERKKSREAIKALKAAAKEERCPISQDTNN